ncbi:hypothetical protein B0H14DRAFT_3478734 [Mycena olivaceomarginata]|nr:hypothetical protein B0H14DRAFT_3478734 [Mycena olivaceomarginata]
MFASHRVILPSSFACHRIASVLPLSLHTPQLCHIGHPPWSAIVLAIVLLDFRTPPTFTFPLASLKRTPTAMPKPGLRSPPATVVGHQAVNGAPGAVGAPAVDGDRPLPPPSAAGG